MIPNHIRHGIERLQKRIVELTAFDTHSVQDENDPALDQLKVAISQTIADVFENSADDQRRYQLAVDLDPDRRSRSTKRSGSALNGDGSYHVGSADYQVDVLASLSRGKKRAITLLTQAVAALEERLEYTTNIAPLQNNELGMLGMTDAEIRGRLLEHFHKLQYNNGGWVPISETILAPEPVELRVIGGVCQQLADIGLIQWKPLQGSGGIVAGMAKITGNGVAAIEAEYSSEIDIRFPSKDAITPNTQTSKTEFTPEAAKAVYAAIVGLVSAGKRAYSLAVPTEAEKLLIQHSGGRINRADASSQIKAAIIGLAKEGKIYASAIPREDWLIKEPLVQVSAKMSVAAKKIFVVHGHEGEPRQAIARFLEQLDLEPIILHEQTNQGRTVIEKFEAHADVGFAVVLLTPDDIGGARDGVQQLRARQNVILEWGYFIGRLGRSHVCALKKGEVELPSDILGIVWEPYDEHGAWKQKLAKELEDAGFTIDWRKVGRS